MSICTQEISDLMATPTVTIFDESGKAMEVSYDAETHTFTEQTRPTPSPTTRRKRR